ncbi:substrate-binding domain-containing protein [Halocella sp. SP3-1]
MSRLSEIFILCNCQKPEFIDPPLTTISQPGKKMGEIATELLLKLIQGNI